MLLYFLTLKCDKYEISIFVCYVMFTFYNADRIASINVHTFVVTNDIIISKKVSLCNIMFYILLISIDNNNNNNPLFKTCKIHSVHSKKKEKEKKKGVKCIPSLV